MFAIIYKPYPLEERKFAQLKLAIIFGFAIFLLLFFVNPFGESAGAGTLVINSAMAGLLTSAVIAIDFFVFFPLFPDFFTEEKWTIGREIIWSLIIIITIATANVLIAVLLGYQHLSLLNWVTAIFYTIVFGIAPITISILLNQARLIRIYRKETSRINESLQENTVSQPIKENVPGKQETDTQLLVLYAENEKDNMSLRLPDFLAATSADNYIKVYYRENEKLKLVVLRSTLKKVEENAAGFSNLMRCHRTAFVNLASVKNITGSAQGYRLHLELLPEEIPVSRSLNQTIKERLAAIHP